ncbi:glutamate ABC transporter substrate-binding protein [Nonomuraea sp. KC401]|uniref:glutamate ABC transporter substrate-binding protein n=1 Tax=unclassified Nonomuraea TaxID=2593643 RepID=UPI0010FE2903|nr:MULTISPECIES: glutamate ABC transporter substrate-binding protein [unclassified Nonomuraea]NBE92009.1 transporter substrate-binding domain-containing protein [Nonomuraea sp. K271]TLF58261.1 glutamate ABC transporter substrate-binding protein [Nonomuraea sp. KC401]
MHMRRTGALLSVAALAAGLTACGGDEQSYATVLEKVQGANTIVVGTKWDQPSLGLKMGAEPEGFDVDVAKALVKELAGGKEVEIEWKESASSNREPFLQNGTVDMIVATYSITEERKGKVTFGGPYVVAHQDVMVRKDDTSINSPQDLKGKKICKAAGSNSYKRITDPPPDGELDIDATTVDAANYSECVQKLSGSNLDAVTTDDLILAGFAKQAGGNFKVLGQGFTDEKYGVGLKKGDTKTCEAVNTAVKKLWDNGTMKQLLDKWFGGIQGLKLSEAAPPAEGCS